MSLLYKFPGYFINIEFSFLVLVHNEVFMSK